MKGWFCSWTFKLEVKLQRAVASKFTITSNDFWIKYFHVYLDFKLMSVRRYILLQEAIVFSVDYEVNLVDCLFCKIEIHHLMNLGSHKNDFLFVYE